MIEINDETLMAFADGALDDADAIAVENRIADDPEALKKVRMFKESGALAQRALAEAAQAPVPDRLLRSVMTAPDAKNRAQGRLQPRRRWLDWLGGLTRPAVPVAASIMLVVGLGGGYFLSEIGGRGVEERGLFSAAELDRGRLGRALESAVSGRPVTWRTDRSDATIQLLVRATFRNKQGEFCREYEEDLNQGGRVFHFFGIACRTGASTWETRVVAAAPPAESPGGAVFRPAGDEGLAVIETALDVMIEGRPFSTQEESQVLAKGWTSN